MLWEEQAVLGLAAGVGQAILPLSCPVGGLSSAQNNAGSMAAPSFSCASQRVG
jgi:hypothetical protein